MTEEKIEIAMERMGDAIEKTVDGAANKAWLTSSDSRDCKNNIFFNWCRAYCKYHTTYRKRKYYSRQNMFDKWLYCYCCRNC